MDIELMKNILITKKRDERTEEEINQLMKITEVFYIHFNNRICCL